MALIENVTLFIRDFSVQEGLTVLEPMIVFIIGMVIYSMFIFKFYNLISRRVVFTFTGGTYSQHSGLKKFAYILEYIFLFPVITFIWFFVISVILAMISEVLTIGNVFLISMAVLATIRITAYYDENLSRDVAKLLPFALLAIFLLDISTISIHTPFEIISQLSGIGKELIYYFGFIFIVEVVLKVIGHHVGSGSTKSRKEVSPVIDGKRN
ncbi:MAG: hypothetical protein ABIH52_03090 [Candidatus Aenigmatarchaeota archaeon]|nr:hypothetical protein [Nanoarchaeota archaeon]